MSRNPFQQASASAGLTFPIVAILGLSLALVVTLLAHHLVG